MFITLLTHATELNKISNTGQLVLAVLAQQDSLSCERVIWQRKLPCAKLLARINSMPSALVYPSLDEQPPLPLTEPLPGHIILLDATWQQARKMYNQSPYLHPLRNLELKPERASQYQLRRNQREHGLCTSECVAELLRLENRPVLAERLDTELALKQTR